VWGAESLRRRDPGPGRPRDPSEPSGRSPDRTVTVPVVVARGRRTNPLCRGSLPCLLRRRGDEGSGARRRPAPLCARGPRSSGRDARRADALVALASVRIASDADPDRTTVVVHVPLEVLTGPSGRRDGGEDGRGDDESGCGLEGGGVIHAETARRLACTARIETVIEDQTGRVVGLGRTSREPPPQMLRALRRRDDGCRFPGCGSRRFTHAHHIRWWSGGGRTDLDNLVMVCSFHHTLVTSTGGGSSAIRKGPSRGSTRMGCATVRSRRRCRCGRDRVVAEPAWLELIVALEDVRDRLVLEHGIEGRGDDRRDREHDQPVAQHLRLLLGDGQRVRDDDVLDG
jgi:Domain of unknown function (DUF222)/HNH endonuclease